MTSSYKPIGQFIQQVKTRNKELNHGTPKGININKVFMPSVANTTGTDLSKYRVVNKHQFAYNPMHVGRDGVLPIAMLDQDEAVIVSPAYVVFEVIDHEELLPEYLMMWCRRPEFDRNAWFTTDSSVRGGFNWDDLCAMELPVPDIDVQREIVREYNVIVDRIRLNEQFCTKLEETAQALYKHWFVDFEFPISAEYASSIGKPELEGKPYKSSGGEMKFCDAYNADIPNAWSFSSIHSLIDQNILHKNQDGNHGEIHPKSSDFVDKGIPFIMANDVENGVVNFSSCKFITKEQADSLRIGFAMSGDVLLTHKATMGRVAIVPDVANYIMLTPQVTYYRIADTKKLSKEYLYSAFRSEKFQNVLIGDSEQSTRKYLGITAQRLLHIISPTEGVMAQFTELSSKIQNLKTFVNKEFSQLEAFIALLSARMSSGEQL